MSLHDEKGTGAQLLVSNATLNAAGKYGAAIQFNGSETTRLDSNAIMSALATTHMRNYAVGAWIKINVDPTTQVRFFNVGHGTEYSVLEVRNGNELAYFTRNDGQDQNVGPGTMGYAEDGIWAHIIQFYSEDEGRAGIYYNTTLRVFNLTIPNLASTLNTAPDPLWFMELNGLVQHIWFADYVPTQEQVNTLLA